MVKVYQTSQSSNPFRHIHVGDRYCWQKIAVSPTFLLSFIALRWDLFWCSVLNDASSWNLILSLPGPCRTSMSSPSPSSDVQKFSAGHPVLWRPDCYCKAWLQFLDKEKSCRSKLAYYCDFFKYKKKLDCILDRVQWRHVTSIRAQSTVNNCSPIWYSTYINI